MLLLWVASDCIHVHSWNGIACKHTDPFSSKPDPQVGKNQNTTTDRSVLFSATQEAEYALTEK